MKSAYFFDRSSRRTPCLQIQIQHSPRKSRSESKPKKTLGTQIQNKIQPTPFLKLTQKQSEARSIDFKQSKRKRMQ